MFRERSLFAFGSLRSFASAILHGTELIAHAEEGLNSVELANAMLYSSLTHSDVKLPLDGDAFWAKLQELIEHSSFQKTEGKNMTAGDDFSKSFAN